MTRYRKHYRPAIHGALSIILVFALTLQMQAQVGDPSPKTGLLKRGQVLELSLIAPLDSSRAEVGEDVAMRVVRPLLADGLAVLPADSLVHGQITSVTRAGKNCRSGLVRWKLDHLSTPGGKQVRVQFIPGYLAKPNGTLVDQVELDTTGEKLNRAAGNTGKVAVITPFVLLSLPWIVFMAIAMSGEGRCDGATGKDEIVPAGTSFYIAISHNATQVLP